MRGRRGSEVEGGCETRNVVPPSQEMAAATDTRCSDPPREFGIVPGDPVPAKEEPDIRQLCVQLGSCPYEGSVILLRIKASHQPNEWCLCGNSQLATHGQARRWVGPKS